MIRLLLSALSPSINTHCPSPSPIFKSNPNSLVSHACKFNLRFFPRRWPKWDLPPADEYLEPKASETCNIDYELPKEMDVSTNELKKMVSKYINGDEKLLPDLADAILKRNRYGGHEESDAELMDDINHSKVKFNQERLRADIDSKYSTASGDECPTWEQEKKFGFDHYSKKNPSFNITPQKLENWASEDLKDGEDPNFFFHRLEDAALRAKLPAEIRIAYRNKREEVDDMVLKGEISVEKANEIYTCFTNKLASENSQSKRGRDENPVEAHKGQKVWKTNTRTPPVVGPTLRWEIQQHHAKRNDLSPRGTYHSDNKIVRMAVTVKELGLNKYEKHRLITLAQKRYTPFKDELKIICRRFDHREENKKECYRVLLALIDEAKKANQLVEEAQKSLIRERMRHDPIFMERLRAKVQKRLESSDSAPA